MFNPEWGMVNQLIFKFTGETDQLAERSDGALTMAIGVHSEIVPFWKLF